MSTIGKFYSPLIRKFENNCRTFYNPCDGIHGIRYVTDELYFTQTVTITTSLTVCYDQYHPGGVSAPTGGDMVSCSLSARDHQSTQDFLHTKMRSRIARVRFQPGLFTLGS